MNYEDNLRHLAEPAAPNERRMAVSTTMPDFEALWLSEALREYAHYGDHPDESHQDIAIAYVEYIERQVRENERKHVSLYAHTDEAADTLMGAMFHETTEDDLVSRISPKLADLYVEHAEGTAPSEPAEVEEFETVEFGEGNAGEAIAIAEMERAESEALQELEERAEERL